MSQQKIDLAIIGAQKAGTSSLKNYINQHPNVEGHWQTEFGFFGIEDEYVKGYDTMAPRYFNVKADNEPIKRVIKHAHLHGNSKLIARLKEHNPDCELVFVLRDPVDRAYSSYLREKSSGLADYPFEEILGLLDDSDTSLNE